MKRLLGGALPLLLVAGCASAPRRPPPPGPLDNKALHALYDQGFVASFDMLEDEGRLVYRSDGTAAIKGFAVNDAGRWRIDGDRVCTRWQKLRQGAERCVSIERTGGKTYMVRNPDGDVAGTFKLY